MPDKVNGNNYSGKSNIVSLNSSHTPIQPKSELQLNERDQKLATLQKMADNSPYSQRFAHFTSMANNSIPQQPVSQLSKDNNGLPANLKQGVESLSGISMDDVKVHYNSDKPAQLNAHAYAQGTDIHIASGQEKHLPHEAWHVVQQKQGRVQPTTMMKAKVFINDDKGLEKEADVMGARALQMKPFSLSDYKTEKSVQRKEIIQKAREKRSNAVTERNIHAEGAGINISNDIIGAASPLKRSNALKLSSASPLKRSNALRDSPLRRSNALKLPSANNEEGNNPSDSADFKTAAGINISDAIIGAASPLRRSNAIISSSAKAEEGEKGDLDVTINAILDALGEDGLVSSLNSKGDMVDKIGTTIEEVSGLVMSEGGLSATLDKTEFLGPLGSANEFFSNVIKVKEKATGENMANIFLAANKFSADVIDASDTLKDAVGIGDELSKGFLLLPGIKAGLSLAKNAVDLYKNYKNIAQLDALKDGITTLTDKDKEIIANYRDKLTTIRLELIIDGVLNAAEAATIWCPAASISIAAIHSATNVFKNAYNAYYEFIANREGKRAERIGDVSVDELKTSEIEKKSINPSFINAIKLLSRLEEIDSQKDKTEGDSEEFMNINKDLRTLLSVMNENKTTETPITIANLYKFLEYETSTINKIAEEVKVEKKWYEKIYYIFADHPKKDSIIKEMRENSRFFIDDDEITLDKIHKLNPKEENYFFNKTRQAIIIASNRTKFSLDERKNDLEKMIKNHSNDPTARKWLIDLYKDSEIYSDADHIEIKFDKCLAKFIEDVKN